MKIAIYGLPCAGKTSLMDILKNQFDFVSAVNGSSKLRELAGRPLDELSEGRLNELRRAYTDYIQRIGSAYCLISDGHYSFLTEDETKIAFTQADGGLYDVFLYLYCSPAELLKRYKKSEKNKRYAELPVDTIARWQNFEIDSLREECHKRNKDFFVIDDIRPLKKYFCDEVLESVTASKVFTFIGVLYKDFAKRQVPRTSFMAVETARALCNRIMKLYPEPCELSLVDGDKTIIKEDSYRLIDGTTSVFDNNVYTGYQSFLFDQETTGKNPFTVSLLDNVTLNKFVWDKVQDTDFVVLSSGLDRIWRRIAKKFGLKTVIASPLISADTKYYVVKFLSEKGYRITCYGDSMVDYYALKEAAKGYLCAGRRLSRSLAGRDLSGLEILSEGGLFVLQERAEETLGLSESQRINSLINLTRSSSGLVGSPLASAHFELGRILGERAAATVPSDDAMVIVLDRGGRFFGDGFYIGFGGHFAPFNPKLDELPKITCNTVIIVDAVINTGHTVRELIRRIHDVYPSVTKIIVAANVVQKDAVVPLSEYLGFIVRISANSFVGENCAVQHGKVGPDTADRLFNLIKDRFDRRK